MQKDISNKIRLLLNELAILNQPDVYEGKFFYSPATLVQLKNLSTELYLLADSLLEGSTGKERMESTKPTEEEKPAVLELPKVPEITVKELPMVEEIKAPVPEQKPIPIVQEVQVPMPPPEPVVMEKPTVVLEKKVSETHSAEGSDIFHGKISFTRRFEYVNNLFGGDSGAFAQFLKEISAAPDKTAALHIFESTFESRNWKKRAETSDDLKSLIKKVK